MTVNFTKGKFNLREKLKELERPSTDKLVTKDADGKAYIDTISGNTKLENIDSVISDTAVDIFIYDTSKDSDGGAWRKRTTHTSWYNETLNTVIRGSRREFPAVVVIVAQDDYVYLYDGDDPDLPMWMVFSAGNANGNNMIGRTNETTRSVSMLNGLMCVGRDPFGLHMINFIADRARFKENGYDTPYTLPIGTNRNGGNTWLGVNVDGNDLVDDTVNDVAMTVLPNAPIDPATGLPTPTIAVGTNLGVSVITDSGNVYEVTGFSPVQQTGFSDDKLFIHTVNSSVTYAAIGRRELTADIALNAWEYGDQFNYSSTPWANWLPPSHTKAIVTPTNEIVFGGGSSGLFKLQTDDQVETNGDSSHLDCEITTSYNTGWMHGNIKGAFLSDTDTTNFVGTELHPNGNSDFSSTDVSYFNNTASGTATVTSGQLVVSGGTAGYSDHIITVNTEVGAKYVISIDYVTNNGNNGSIGMYVNGAYLNELNDNSGYIARSTGKTYTWYFTADATTENLDLVTAGSASNTYTFDNWTIKKVEEDRSVNDNGLQVFGTITKTAVADGAELVGYHGVNLNNYIQQPYNSDLNFGTGDFSIFVWVLNNSNSTNHYIIDRAPVPFSSTGRSYFIINGSGYHRFRLAGGNQHTGTVRAMPTGTYNHIGFVRRSGAMEYWMNGDLVQTVTGSDASASFDAGVTGQVMTVDRYANGFSNDYTFDRMSLLRISATTPSPEQVKKMYEDEKVLFQENAKATLYGSSDVVTALAYDEVTDRLHVGTSSGRSDFQGLCRINNTTAAVTTAISAHDEFIVEQ